MSDALDAFSMIERSDYSAFTKAERKTLLLIKVEDISMCDCDARGLDCSDDGCLNRAMKEECVVGYCKCASRCRNSRIQTNECARVERVDAGGKGQGLVAGEDLEKDTFLLE